MKHLSHPKYRADIDGLRAIAVLSVIGFHAFPSFFQGGFIGVDVFFVISGYLISMIIFDSLERNSFSFLDFYSRRIRRIFPALILVLVTVYVFGWFALLADEYQQLGKHIAGGAGFISNFLFLGESGYFDNAAETKPLLHLWSLAIEEQFYIVWPLLLWLAWKKRLNLLIITIAVGIISFVINLWMVRNNLSIAFYSPQTRFWELLMGSVLAYMTLHEKAILPTFQQWLYKLFGHMSYKQAHEIDYDTLRNVQSTIGFVLIALGVLVITKDRHFPGWWALLPTIGTVLIISAGKFAWINRVVLSSRILVWFGLISFPLYLWHWPLLSFMRIIESQVPSIVMRVTAVAISIVLAWLTYRLIERPIRIGKQDKFKTIMLLTLMVVIGYIGYNTYKNNGFDFRSATQLKFLNEGDIGHEEFHKYPLSKSYLCTPANIEKEALLWNDSVRCLQSKQNEPVTLALIGDSHAEHLFIGLAEQLTETNIAFYIKSSLPYGDQKEFENIFKYVISDKNIKTVVLTGFWNQRPGAVAIDKALKIKISNAILKLKEANKKVFITDDVPNFSFAPQLCKYSRRFSYMNNCIDDGNYFSKQYDNYYPVLQEIQKEISGVEMIHTAKYFCQNGFCSMAKNGKLFYRDNHHLNINGSKYLGRKIVENNPKLTENL